ncbi:MAG: phosphatidylserine decarboxylase [Planctomycetota bacterium]
MRIAPWGRQTILWTLVFCAWTGWLLWPTPVFWYCLPILLFLVVFTLAFFRDPGGRPQGDAHTLIAPASGVVADVETVDAAPFLDGPAVRIGIFLSVFDVHVNRMPVAARVLWSEHRPGGFLDARDPAAGNHNECMALGLEVDPSVRPGTRLLLRQISGLIARRIVCTAAPGDHVNQGQLYGMIRFGSRTELWLPSNCAHTLLVSPGQRVRCGVTPLARLEGAGEPASGDE